MRKRTAFALLAVLLAPALSGCDWIKSLWSDKDVKSGAAESPAPAPMQGTIEVAKPVPPPAPKPATDPDSVLAASVTTALREDPELGMLALDVKASGGAVTLYGTANTREARNKAAVVAGGVPGVKSVKNELVIVAGS